MARVSKELVEQAKGVLDFNWTGEYTRPGPRLYPHQWSWDSGLIAIGYSHYDQDKAARELRHLLESQWKNGLLPQIVFNARMRRVLPGHRLLARGPQPRLPARSQDLRRGPASHPRHGRFARVPAGDGPESGAGVPPLRLSAARGLARLLVTGSVTPEARGWSTSAIRGSPAWTTRRCGIPSWSDSGSSRIRYPSTSAPTRTSSPPRTGPRPPSTTASRTWSSCSPTATTTRPGSRRTARSWCRMCCSTRCSARRIGTSRRSHGSSARITPPWRSGLDGRPAPWTTSSGTMNARPTWVTTWSPTGTYPRTSRRTSRGRCTPASPTTTRPEASWRTCTSRSASRTRTSRPCPATTRTGSGSPRCGTGGVRCGST